MMRKMREVTKPIMLFTAAAFVALMVFQWGMDITGRSSGGVGEIGTVNGTPVTYEAYQNTYRNLYDRVQQSQEGPLTSQQNKEIEDAAWDDVVNQILIRQELKRRGIGVTDAELRQAAQFSPPPEFRNDPAFQTKDGRFNIQAYQSYLAGLPESQLMLLEAYYRDVIPRGKLLRQVSSGIFPSDGELWEQYRDQHETVTIRYVPLNPATRYDDEDFPISDSEIEAYYRAHQDEFKIPARATVKAVVLDKTPTAADTAASLAKAEAVRKELLDGADFTEVAKRESADKATAEKGGDLGTIVKGRMVAPFDSAVFHARIGRPTEPVETGFGFHIIEVTKRWADSARARHILIPIKRTDDSEIELLVRADSLEELAQSLPLEDAASKLGLSTSTVDITENFAFVAGAGQIGEGADWAFQEASPGDVSPVYENEQAFYALELVDAQPAGILPLADARTSIETTLRFDKKKERAHQEGEELVKRVRSGEALENVAADMGLEIRTAGPFSRNDFVPGIGRQNAAIGAAFGLTPGTISDVIVTPANAYVIDVLERTPADSSAWVDQKMAQRQQVLDALRQSRLQEWLQALRASADIVDRRAEVLQPQDQNAPLQQGPLGTRTR